jgi:V8-like Glu-specific endopeptidase
MQFLLLAAKSDNCARYPRKSCHTRSTATVWEAEVSKSRATTKQKSQNGDQENAGNQPVPPVDLPFDDEVAEQPVPDEVDKALSDRPLDVFLGDRRATPEELCTALRERADLVLPAEFSTTLVAEHTVNLADEDVADEPGQCEPGDSYRPPWVDTVFRPKPPLEPVKRNLRAADGGIVRPLVDERIFGLDDRKVFVPKGFPWHCIGKLSILNKSGEKVSGGTATLVGRRTIVTAAHIMPSDRSSFSSARFVAGKFGGSTLSRRSVLGDDAASYVTRVRGFFAHEVGNDIMIMRLSEPLGDWFGYLGFAVYDDNWEDMPRWTHVGYPGGLSTFPFKEGGVYPYRQEQIAVYDDDSGPNDSLELQHYGDAGKGDSGGPLLGWFGMPELGLPYKVMIVGVMSGNYQNPGGFLGLGSYDHNVHAGGNALTRLCRYGRNNWD